MNILAELQASDYLRHYESIMRSGKIIRPRGEEVKEVSDLQLNVTPSYPFMTFASRNYNIDYFKKEMRWKLGASQYDLSIQQHAKIWKHVVNPDQSYNSNYGYYWFGPQNGIWSVVTELIRDPDSRRAVIPMLAAKHMEPWDVDTVCTEAVGFRIRDGQLDCSVHMRSSDAVFGLGTDIPTFTFLFNMVYALILPCIPDLVRMGDMKITMMSAHIYSRHYEMVHKILNEGVSSYEAIRFPEVDYSEALMLISHRGKDYIPAPAHKLTSWLYSEQRMP